MRSATICWTVRTNTASSLIQYVAVFLQHTVIFIHIYHICYCVFNLFINQNQ